MIWKREALKYWCTDITRKLYVAKSTVSRTVNVLRSSGNVNKRTYPVGKTFCKLPSLAHLLILHLVPQRPGIFLQDELLPTLEIEVSESAICKLRVL